ncbi:DUF971 domain-containing protein [Porticoccaceae bacterium]|jgi:DUF971 family protein|nr:DUF971 domain-containing protein [Porticoccaceae bacterium]MDB9843828.1 DUF971 domain-containing protein [Porticoccaceae bacterium]CAI8368092.1 MAG: Uncharacterised protein [SAR92 bacterium MED-G29]|tara:strand:- start:12597 stop:12974 length:378 start_codon:yes stop_codon:yes gene_type:complete
MPVPSRIVVSEKKDALNMQYQGDVRFNLPAEYLRVFSPSAEVRGHGRGQEVLQIGKRDVLIKAIAKSGNYAIQITFDDGHDSGIFTWDYLFELGSNQTDNWADYVQRLHQANQSRDPDTQVVKLS